jgi:hypothetical protein
VNISSFYRFIEARHENAAVERSARLSQRDTRAPCHPKSLIEIFGGLLCDSTEEGETTVEKKSQPLTNDTANLVPKTAFDVPALEFDFPALQIGVAAYEEGPTGCTVFRFLRDPTSARRVSDTLIGNSSNESLPGKRQKSRPRGRTRR